jgi:hypothetical protein
VSFVTRSTDDHRALADDKLFDKKRMFDHEGSRLEFLKLLAEVGEEPAFIARANAVHFAYESFLQACQAKHEELLEWPRYHLANLAQRIGENWLRIAPLLVNPATVTELESFHARSPFTGSAKANWYATDRACLRQFVESAERFNRRWREYLVAIDYESVNKPRRDYNQYYPLERACAFGNERANYEFEPLNMIDIAFLEGRFPYLPIPQLA